jgi:hypothetical protein
MSEPFHTSNPDDQDLYEKFYVTDEFNVVRIVKEQQAIGAMSMQAKPMGSEEVRDFMTQAYLGSIKDKYMKAWEKKKSPA